MSPAEKEGNTLYEALGNHWKPVPIGWGWLKIDAPDGSMLHVLVIETTSGRQGFALPPDAMAAFVDSGRTQISPLSIATSLEDLQL